MKIKLLLSFLFISTFGFAQFPINSFYTDNNSPYLTLTSVNPLDHGTGGANQTWTFGSLLVLGTSTSTNVDPTPAEVTAYPNTNKVIVTTTTEGATTTTGRMFTRNNASNNFSITGLNATDLNINFATNNATLGVFPMAYGYTNTDSNVSGTYTYTTYSGTFTGTLTTSFDAYGTVNLPNFLISRNVVRLKTVLNISMNYGIIMGIGTVTQTSYTYFGMPITPEDVNNIIEFRSINTQAVVPLLSINQNITTLERYNGVQLNNGNHDLDSVWIQNPVQNSIEINSANAIDNAAISVTDMLGKTIYQTKNQNISGTFEIPVSLTKGIYLVKIESENESITKKIVKS